MTIQGAILTGTLLVETTREVYLLEVVPKRAEKARLAHDNERSLRLWRQVADAWTPLTLLTAKKRGARFCRAALLMQLLRHDEAIAEFQKVLAVKSRVPAFDAKVRERLAGCYEAVGKIREANEQREMARRCLLKKFPLQMAGVDFLRLTTEARLAQQRHDIPQQIAFLKQALECVETARARGEKDATQEQNLLILSELALALHHQGEQDEALHYVEHALQISDGTWNVQHVLHSLAGLLHNLQGDLEQAYLHRVLALRLAETKHNAQDIAKARAELAEVLGKQGQFSVAEREAKMAMGVHPQHDRMALAVLTGIYVNQGEVEKLWETYDKLEEIAAVFQPRAENKLVAARNSDKARNEARFGDANVALNLAEKAIIGFENDTRLRARAKAVRARALAQLGRADEARTEREDVLTMLESLSNDLQTLRVAHSDLASCCMALEDWPSAREHWDKVLSIQPPPSSLPYFYFQRGECEKALGNLNEARSCWQRAVDVPIEETLDARLAREKLATF